MCTRILQVIHLVVAMAYGRVSMFDKTEVMFGDPVTITCDASRADKPLPAYVERIVSLYMAIHLQAKDKREKFSFAVFDYGWTGVPFINRVPGVSWKIEMTGDQNNRSDDPSRNRDTMRIVIRADKITCVENTLFTCTIIHLGGEGWTRVSEALRVYKQGEKEAKHAQLSLDPKRGNEQYISYNSKGDSITLTCTVKNEQKNVRLVWRYGHLKSSRGFNDSYPFHKDIKEEPGTPEPGTCGLFRHESKLSFRFQKIHGGFRFLCVAREDGLDTLSLHFTLLTSPGSCSRARDDDSMLRPPMSIAIIMIQRKFRQDGIERTSPATTTAYTTESSTVFSACCKLNLQQLQLVFHFVVILCRQIPLY